jgi:ribonuclease-3
VGLAVRNPLVAPVHGDHLIAAMPALPGPDAAGAAEAVLGHAFTRPALLREALTHRSAAQGRGAGPDSNERLEFVGDRVLGLLIAEWLAERFPREQEGALGRRLADLVSQPVLAARAAEIGLSALLAVAPGESRAGVRGRATVLADAVEAMIGALYLDGGLEPARRFIRRAWAGAIERQSEPPKDAKTALQERAQARGLGLPAYAIVERSGPPHAPVFLIEVVACGVTGHGTAGTRRAAEQAAAIDALALLAKGVST